MMALQNCKMIYICLVTCRFDNLLLCWFHVEASLVLIDESTLFQRLSLFLKYSATELS